MLVPIATLIKSAGACSTENFSVDSSTSPGQASANSGIDELGADAASEMRRVNGPSVLCRLLIPGLVSAAICVMVHSFGGVPVSTPSCGPVRARNQLLT